MFHGAWTDSANRRSSTRAAACVEGQNKARASPAVEFREYSENWVDSYSIYGTQYSEPFEFWVAKYLVISRFHRSKPFIGISIQEYYFGVKICLDELAGEVHTWCVCDGLYQTYQPIYFLENVCQILAL